MSYQATAWAYELPLIGSQKFVLVALADMADESASCFPGQKRLAAMTGLSVRTVQRALEDLEAHGLITRQRRYAEGYRTSDRYRLNLDVQMLGLDDTVSGDNVSGDTESRDTVTTLGDKYDDLRRHHDVPKNHQLTTREPSGGDAREEPWRCVKHQKAPPVNCGMCADARRAFDQQQKLERDKPTPIPPRGDPGECSPGKHRWIADGTCLLCTARRRGVA